MKISMESFLKNDLQNSSLLKIDLEPHPSTPGFTFVESNIRNEDSGKVLKFSPMKDAIIWDESDPCKRAMRGVQWFITRDQDFLIEDTKEFTDLICKKIDEMLNS